ncbi:unnamed protein product [Phaedon cochleariae]|uniref:RNA helicase n=1 Tax=Phaedon cochleariae TaxID=80249 RepID=A0A9N9SLB8_PHACE|nr:unnamed protein product [Phaedon cochleariae]
MKKTCHHFVGFLPDRGFACRNILKPALHGMKKNEEENVKKLGYTKPTPIQKYAIPLIMNGRNKNHPPLNGLLPSGKGLPTKEFLSRPSTAKM